MNKEVMIMKCGGINNYRMGMYFANPGEIPTRCTRIEIDPEDSDIGTIYGVQIQGLERISHEFDNKMLALKWEIKYLKEDFTEFFSGKISPLFLIEKLARKYPRTWYGEKFALKMSMKLRNSRMKKKEG